MNKRNLLQRFSFLFSSPNEEKVSFFLKLQAEFSFFSLWSSLISLVLFVLSLSLTGRLHATNNPYQRYGPKGFIHVKVLQNDHLYVRVDLPGVPDDAIRCRIDSVRQKVVFFSGETLGDEIDDVREYSGTAGLGCDCCEITGVDAKMKDGVLRLILSRVKVKGPHNKCTHTVPPNTGKSGSYTLDERGGISKEEVEDHPFVVKGRKDTHTRSEPNADGVVWYSVDVPGVCSDDILVLPNENEIKFFAENKEVYEHDESCRIYMGAVKHSTICSPRIPLLRHHISWDAEFGVLKVRVSPPRNNTT